MADRGVDVNNERIVSEPDGVLLGEIDRRNFLQGVAGSVGAMMLAGCTGGGGGATNGGFQEIVW